MLNNNAQFLLDVIVFTDETSSSFTQTRDNQKGLSKINKGRKKSLPNRVTELPIVHARRSDECDEEISPSNSTAEIRTQYPDGKVCPKINFNEYALLKTKLPFIYIDVQLNKYYYTLLRKRDHRLPTLKHSLKL